MPNNDKAFPTAMQAALLLLAGFLFEYLVIIGLYDLRHTLGLNPEQLTALGSLVSYGVIITAVTHKLGIGYRELIHPAQSSPGITFVLLVPPILLLLPLVLLLDESLIQFLQWLFPLSSWEQAAFTRMVDSSIAAFIATCVFAPIFEEMLFRGILLRSFLKLYPRGLAISYSALFFGVAHLNIYQFFLAFFLGLLLGWLYERAQSLIPCIALHAAINTTVYMMGSPDAGQQATDSGLSADLSVWLFALIAATAGAVALRHLLSRSSHK